MPTPNKTETKENFIGRCIPMMIHEGRKRDQAVAICHSLWKNKKAAKYKVAYGVKV